jgi:naphthoate synthase
MRRTPKPIVAMVAGWAIGGGQVLSVVCDLAIAADNASFGQVGPRVGSFDGGFGASLLAPRSGRSARPRRSGSSAASTTRAGAGDGALSTRWSRSPTGGRDRAWCREMLALSPFALRLMKASFHAAEDGYAGIQQLAHDANLLFYGSEEAKEGRTAYTQKRPPDFSQFPRRP